VVFVSPHHKYDTKTALTVSTTPAMGEALKKPFPITSYHLIRRSLALDSAGMARPDHATGGCSMPPVKAPMRPVFWVSADAILKEFIVENVALQRIAERYPCYFMCSGEVEGADGPEPMARFLSRYYRARTITCPNHMSLKGKLLFDRLNAGEVAYDFLVRLDLDAIVFDVDRLLETARKHVLGKHAIMGNHFTWFAESWVRGACNVTSRSVIEALDFAVSDNPTSFDLLYTEAVIQAGATIIPVDCFELEESYTGACPVWHPPKLPLVLRLEAFRDQMKVWLRESGGGAPQANP
jgi:hypothetical protein